MRTRDRLSLNVTPLLLRVVLALTFLWAGLGKVMETAPMTGANAAILAELGVIEPGDATPIPPAAEILDEQAPDPAPEPTPDAAPEPDAEAPAPAEPLTDPETDPTADPEPTAGGPTAESLHTRAQIVPVAYRQVADTVRYDPADFTEPVDVLRLYPGVVLRLVRAADPGLDPETSEPIKPIAPSWAGQPPLVVYAGWAAAITEIAAGAFLLIGLLTRLSAFSLVGVMVVAIWLDTIGPAWQAGDVVLGFIPAIPVFSFDWVKPLWQLLVLASTAGLVFSGPGALSLDRVLFGRAKGGSGDDA